MTSVRVATRLVAVLGVLAGMLVAVGVGDVRSASAAVTPASSSATSSSSGSDIAALRTAYQDVYANGDGTDTAVMSDVPVNYLLNGAWVPISTAVVADPAVPGGLMSGGNNWVAHFAPLGSGGGVKVTTPQGPVSWDPVGAAAVAPSVAPSDPSTVVYHDAWPGVDLEYVVSSWGVEEHVLLTSASAPSTFLFDTPGMTLTPGGSAGFTPEGQPATGSPSNPGGLSAGPRGEFTAPRVLDTDGVLRSDAGAALSAVAGTMSLSVLPSWLSALPTSAFPIDLDPSWSSGESQVENFRSDWASTKYTNDGYVDIGNSNANGAGTKTIWRTSVYFNMASIEGAHVVNAEFSVAGNAAGSSSTGNSMSVYPTASFTYSGQGTKYGSVSMTYGGGCLSSVNSRFTQSPVGGCGLVSSDLAGNYNNQAIAKSNGDQLFFTGVESATAYTYDGYKAATLKVLYDHAPNDPSNPSMSPQNACGGYVNTTTPTLSAVVSDPDGGTVYGDFTVTNSAGAVVAAGQSGGVGSGGTASWGVPGGATGNGGQYYWTAQSYDGYYYSADTTPSCPFTVDTVAPPAPSISSSSDPSSTSWYPSTQLNASWAVNGDPTPITGYSVTVDGSPSTVPPASVSQTGTSIQTNVSGSGVWYLHVRALDAGGLWGATGTYSFQVETQAPSFQQLGSAALVSGETIVGTEQIQVGSDPDATGGTVSYDNAGTWTAIGSLGAGSTAGQWTVAWNTTSVPDGPYVLSVQMTYPNSATGPAHTGAVLWVDNSNSVIDEGNGTVDLATPAVLRPTQAAADTQTGLQVNAFTGQLQDSVTDTQTSSPDAVPVEVDREYASGNQTELGPFGYGWTDNYNLTVTPDSSSNQLMSVMDVTQENGSVVSFAQDGSGNWVAPPAVDATLSQNTNTGTWTFVRNGQTTYTFSSSGQLQQIVDTNGFTTVLAYNSNGQLSTATTYTTANTTSGASDVESFTWGACTSSAQCVTQVTDAGGQTLTYAYAGTSGNLTSVTDQAGHVTSYGYQTDLLHTVTEPDGTLTTINTSTGCALPASPNMPVCVSSETGAAATLSWAYSNSGAGSGTTTFTDGDGHQTQDNFSNSQVVADTVPGSAGSTASAQYGTSPGSNQSSGPSQVCTGSTGSSCSTNGVASETYTYNTGQGSADDVTKSVDALNNTTQTAYTANNLPWCQVDAADYANGVTCPSTPWTTVPAPHVDKALGATILVYGSSGGAASSSLLLSRTDPLGNTTVYQYNSAGLVYCQIDPANYDAGSSCPSTPPTAPPTAGSDPWPGDQISIYNAQNLLAYSVDQDGDTTSYTYADPALPTMVTQQTDPDGTVTSTTYDAEGDATAVTVSFGSYSATTTSSYDANRRLYCQVSPLETSRGVNCPTSPPAAPTPGNDPYLGATITTYNAQSQAVQTTNPIGGITLHAFDPNGNEYCTVQPDQTAAGVTCPSSPPAAPTAGNDPYLGATITTFDAQNRAVQVTNPLGGITLTSYDPNGNVLTTTVESGNANDPNVVTTNIYNAGNQKTSTVVDQGGSLAQTTQDFYDPNGNIYCTIDPNASAAGGAQCPTWNPSWISAPQSPASLYSTSPTSYQANQATTTFTNADGQVMQTTNPDIETTVTAYDADERAACSLDATNFAAYETANPAKTYPYQCASPSAGQGMSLTAYDPAGRKTSSSDPLGDTTSWTYTPGGQTLTTTNPDGKTTTNCYYYQDQSGGCAAGAPAAGGSGSDLYSTTTPATTADPNGETTTYTYLPGDIQQTLTTPAGTTTTGYDANGNTTSTIYSNTAAGYTTPANVTTVYNPDGTRQTVTDATGTTTYTYDANGDTTSTALAPAPGLSARTVTYAYYPTGDTQAITYPSYAGQPATPTVTYTYDATGTMASLTDWLGNTIDFTHDPDGNQTGQNNNVSTANPTGTSNTTWTYDNADQNTSAVSALAQSCGSNETLTQSFFGSGGSRNPDGLLTSYTASYNGSCSGQTSQARSYSYDQASRLVYEGTSPQGSIPNNFAYDPAGNPTTISEQDGAGNSDMYTQTFDNAGEATGQTPVGGSQGVATAYTYDSIGDQTRTSSGNNVTTFGYNQLGEMAITTTSASSTSYLYNSDNLLTSEVLDGKTTQYTWDTTWSTSPILSDGGSDYIYGSSDKPVEQISLTSSSPTYLCYFAANSTWISTNRLGNEVGYWGYDPFGTNNFGSSTSPFGFSGQYTDPATGFVYDRARFYVPTIGEFSTRDPLFAKTDLAYQYANDDPINQSDPTGEDSPGGYWSHLTVTPQAPGAQTYKYYGDLVVQYTYRSDTLAWTFRFTPLSSAGFRGAIVDFRWNVWFNTEPISFNYHKDKYPTSYFYHTSMSGYRLHGKGEDEPLTPNNTVEIQTRVENAYAIIIDQVSVRIDG